MYGGFPILKIRRSAQCFDLIINLENEYFLSETLFNKPFLVSTLWREREREREREKKKRSLWEPNDWIKKKQKNIFTNIYSVYFYLNNQTLLSVFLKENKLWNRNVVYRFLKFWKCLIITQQHSTNVLKSNAATRFLYQRISLFNTLKSITKCI